MITRKTGNWAIIGICFLAISLVLPAFGTPVISTIADLQVLEDVYADGVGYTVTDPEFDSVLLGVTAHSSNQELIPDSNIGVIRAGYSGLLTLLPMSNTFGTASITVTVTNPAGASASTVFTYNVVSVNDAPTLDALADMIVTDISGLHVIPLTGITSGATNELQTLAVTAYANPPGILSNLQVAYTSPDTTGTLSFETVTNVVGKATVTVFVDDGGIAYNVTGRIFTVQVNPTNLPPSISEVTDQVTDLDTAKTISFTVGDAETVAEDLVLAAASYNLVLVPLENIILGGSGSNRTATITPAAGQSGVAFISLSVSDANGRQNQVSFFFTVRPDAFTPVISSQPRGQVAGTGGTAQFSVTAVGEAPLTYQWQHEEVDMPLQTNSTLLLTNLQESDAGNYRAVVTNASGSTTSFVAYLDVVARPSFTHIARSGGTATLTFNAEPGILYFIEYKNSLSEANWTLLDVKYGSGSPVVVSDPGAKWPTRFYRLRD